MLSLDQEQSFIVMPICYHPTTVLSVDDEASFLDSLRIMFAKKLSMLCFDSPDKAIEYVKTSRELQLPFAARLRFSGKNDTEGCGFSKMLEGMVQDFIHPFPKEVDMSYVEINNVLTDNNSLENTKTFDDFNYSQYVFTETALYYYNKLEKSCDWISSDIEMLKQLGKNFPKSINLLNHDELNKITEITGHQRPSKLSVSITDFRSELYNRLKFNEIILVTTDYNMPGKNGIEFIQTVAFPGVTLEHVLIILTGRNPNEFKDKLVKLSLPTEYIQKDDMEWESKLLQLIDIKTSRVFQDCSHKVLRILTEDKNEEACFVFDKKFGEMFTAYLRENKICELYLFDRQGSYLLLDENANLSWFIIRSEKGMENSIKKAVALGAPESVIEVLQSRQMVLSLYEHADFSRIKDRLMREQLAAQAELHEEAQNIVNSKEVQIVIDWEKYLHPSSIFESTINRFEAIGGSLEESVDTDNAPRKYFYAFIKQFPEHNIDTSKILSYKTFLKEIAQRDTL